MNRAWLLSVVAGISLSILLSSGVAAAAQVQKKESDKILNKTIGEWIQILRTHENSKFRRAALIALEYGNAASRTGLPAILEAVEKDPDPAIRREAVLLLGRLGPDTRGALKALLERLQTDKADIVREAAATAIGSKFTVAAQDYVPVLADALKDPHAGTRIAVASALRNMGDYAKPAIPALLEAAKKSDEHPLVRAAAIHVLGRWGKDNSQTLPLLVELLLGEQNPAAVREAAADWLGRSGSDSPEVIAALGKNLSANKVELRKAASLALATLGIKSKLAWPLVKARLSVPASEPKGSTKLAEPESSIRNHLIRLSGALARETPDAIPLLTTLAVTEESTENRIAAIQELGDQGPRAKEAVNELAKLATQDARATVRDAAEKALTQINGK